MAKDRRPKIDQKRAKFRAKQLKRSHKAVARFENASTPSTLEKEQAIREVREFETLSTTSGKMSLKTRLRKLYLSTRVAVHEERLNTNWFDAAIERERAHNSNALHHNKQELARLA
jgi:hypothetical protein